MEDQLGKKQETIAAQNHERVSELRDNIASLEHKEMVRNARRKRVIPEPELSDDHLVICVRHTSIGEVKRLFKPEDSNQAIYDWVGSLSHEPVYFKLCLQLSSDPLDPIKNIGATKDLSILNQVELENPVTNNDSVTFLGECSFTNSNEKAYDEIELKRESTCDLLNPVSNLVSVSRENVLDDLLRIFEKKRDIMKACISVRFVNEAATGDGVAREAFSIFMSQLLFKCFEGTSEFIPQVQPEFGVDEFVIIGKIFYQFFINYGVFPLQIARVSMEHVFFGVYETSSLIRSFYNYCSQDEASVLSKAIKNEIFVKEELINILSFYGIRTIPTPNNIYDLVCKIAKNELITKPFPALSSFKQAFGNFFDNPKSIHAIYDLAIPTATNILDHIQFPEALDSMEEKAFSFLRRYIREAGVEVLQAFLQYVTGSTFILPGLKIGVSAVLMNELETRPISKTCIKTLTISKNLPTYYAFKKNMDFYLIHNELWAMED